MTWLDELIEATVRFAADVLSLPTEVGERVAREMVTMDELDYLGRDQ